jgi:hypothetical protein
MRPVHCGAHIITYGQFIFIIYGAVTVLVGVLLFFGLPDSPAKAWFFNEQERKLAIVRLASNQTGTDVEQVRLLAMRALRHASNG